MSLMQFPWDNGEKPYFVNPEGFEWYVDKDTTDYARQDKYLWGKGVHEGLKDCVVFYVKKGNDVTRVLLNSKQQVLYESKNLEAMRGHIDLLKASKSFDAADEKREKPNPKKRKYTK